MDVVGMDVQSSACCTSSLTSPLREWPDYFVLVIAAVEFAPAWKNVYYVESRGFQTMVDRQKSILFSALGLENS
jgi:hypothetical protein